MIYNKTNTYKEIFQQPEMWKQTFNIIDNNKKEISSFWSVAQAIKHF